MNGNLTIIDNAAVNGRRKDFTMIQNSVIGALEGTPHVLGLYLILLRAAGTEFNLTTKSIAQKMNSSERKVLNSLNKLKELGLLEERKDRLEAGALKTIQTQSGRTVPNNCRHWIVYTALPAGAAAPKTAGREAPARRAESERLPWRPGWGEVYYTYILGFPATYILGFPDDDGRNGRDWEVITQYWYDTTLGFRRLYAGIVFKTKEAAEAALPEVYKRFTGKEWGKEQ